MLCQIHKANAIWIPFGRNMCVIKARTPGCVRNGNETHSTSVTVSCVSLSFHTHLCVLGIQLHTIYSMGASYGNDLYSGHHSSVFHCQWTHNQVFLHLSHMLIWNAKSIFIYVMKYVSGFIWKLGINFAVCIKWIDENWWNNRLLLVPNCYEVVAMVAPMVAMVAPLWCHTFR